MQSFPATGRHILPQPQILRAKTFASGRQPHPDHESGVGLSNSTETGSPQRGPAGIVGTAITLCGFFRYSKWRSFADILLRQKDDSPPGKVLPLPSSRRPHR